MSNKNKSTKGQNPPLTEMDLQLAYAKEMGRYPASSIATRGLTTYGGGVNRDDNLKPYCEWLQSKLIKTLNTLIS